MLRMPSADVHVSGQALSASSSTSRRCPGPPTWRPWPWVPRPRAGNPNLATLTGLCGCAGLVLTDSDTFAAQLRGSAKVRST